MLPLFALLLLALPPDPVQEPAQPVVAAPLVEVELAVVRPLVRTRFYFVDEGKEEEVGEGLDGELVVRLKNVSKDRSTAVEDLDVHNLVFKNLDTGKDHVVIHPCACFIACKGGRPKYYPKRFELGPGEVKVIKLSEWGCSSFWHPPPPGRYMVRARYKRFRQPRRRPPWCLPKTSSIRERKAACRKALESPGSWRNAWVSEPVKLDLRKLTRTKIDID